MFLTPFYESNADEVTVSAQQASDFAKQIAGDFNPIHNVGAKRFCVPGDLLFALVLNEYGLSPKMTFTFSGMVGADVNLLLPATDEAEFAIKDSKDKSYLSVERSGKPLKCPVQIEAFIRSYVAFSGLNFIHVLIPMMKQHKMMINPARPLVIYESMSVNLLDFDFDHVELSLVEQKLVIDGKRGDVTLKFELRCGERLVGTGEKSLVMSGLRPYDAPLLDQMVATYEASCTN